METIVSICSTIVLLCPDDLCPWTTSITCRPIYFLYFCVEVNKSQNAINWKSQLSHDTNMTLKYLAHLSPNKIIENWLPEVSPIFDVSIIISLDMQAPVHNNTIKNREYAWIQSKVDFSKHISYSQDKIIYYVGYLLSFQVLSLLGELLAFEFRL